MRPHYRDPGLTVSRKGYAAQDALDRALIDRMMKSGKRGTANEYLPCLFLKIKPRSTSRGIAWLTSPAEKAFTLSHFFDFDT